MSIREFHYKVPWRSKASLQGFHRSARSGTGLEFHDHRPLLDSPDPRRLDVYASLRDPFQQLLARVYRERNAVPVCIVADLSASMGFRGAGQKLNVLADFTASLGYSTYRTGDRFGFIGCDSAVRSDFVLLPSRIKSSGLELSIRLRDLTLKGQNSKGLLRASDLLPSQRCLVFLVSDYHLSFDLVDSIFVSLSRHQVVPVVLHDSAEFANLPAFGLARVLDPESGKQRTLVLRPLLRERIAEAFAERKRKLTRRLRSFGARPLFMCDRFNPDDVTRHFYG